MALKAKTGQSARFYHTHQVHYLYKRFNGFDIDITATQPGIFALVTLPAHSMPLECVVRVNAAFTSGEILVGTSAAGSSAVVVSTADVANATTGVYISDRYMGTYSTVDVPLFIQ